MIVSENVKSKLKKFKCQNYFIKSEFRESVKHIGTGTYKNSPLYFISPDFENFDEV